MWEDMLDISKIERGERDGLDERKWERENFKLLYYYSFTLNEKS